MSAPGRSGRSHSRPGPSRGCASARVFVSELLCNDEGILLFLKLQRKCMNYKENGREVSGDEPPVSRETHRSFDGWQCCCPSATKCIYRFACAWPLSDALALAGHGNVGQGQTPAATSQHSENRHLLMRAGKKRQTVKHRFSGSSCSPPAEMDSSCHVSSVQLPGGTGLDTATPAAASAFGTFAPRARGPSREPRVHLCLYRARPCRARCQLVLGADSMVLMKEP